MEYNKLIKKKTASGSKLFVPDFICGFNQKLFGFIEVVDFLDQAYKDLGELREPDCREDINMN